jgi:hypothetical protein
MEFCVLKSLLSQATVLLLFFIFGTLASCGGQAAPTLAIVGEVAPDIVEPHDIIHIKGAGFVEGPAQVTLQGLFKPMGLAPGKERTVRLDGTAGSASLVEVFVTPLLMERLADEPTRFSGNIEIAFPTAATLDAVHIVARRESVSFEIRPAGGGVVLAAKRSHKAAMFLQKIGLVLSGSANGDGLFVSRVTTGGQAELSGVRSGDRLLAVDGIPLAALSDLDGIEKAKSHRFEFVSTSGIFKEVSLGALPQAHLDSDEFTAIVLSSIALGFFLAFVAPTRRFLSRPQASLTDPVAKAVGFGIVSIPLLLIPAGALLTGAGVYSTLLLSGINVLGLAVIAFYDKGPPVKRLFSFLMHLLPLPIVVVVAGASGSAIGLWDVVASQEATPWGWHAWSSPFALGAVIATLTLLWPSTQSGSHMSRLVGVATWMAATPLAAMVTTYCLGGWALPGIPLSRIADNGWLLALSVFIFFVKTWAVLLIARWFDATGMKERRQRNRTASRLVPRFVVLVIAAVLALAWVWVDLPDSYRVTGQILATAASVTFFTALTIFGLKNAIPSVGRSFDRA